MPETPPSPTSADAHDVDMTALLGSRLCHDLASPLGALNNGVELLELSQAAPSEEMALLRATLDATLARLRFFRLAFGGGSADGEVGAAEASGIVAAMWRDSRRSVTWEDDAPRPRSEIRLAFLALACVESATPWPARVAVRRDGGGWVIEAAADRLKPLAHWDALDAGRVPSDLASAEVQFGILAQAAAKMGRAASVTTSDTAIRLAI